MISVRGERDVKHIATFRVTEAYLLAGWQVGVHEGFGDFVIPQVDSVDVPKLCRNIHTVSTTPGCTVHHHYDSGLN